MRKRFKNLTALVLAMVMALSLNVVAFAETTKDVSLTIVHTNDVHSRIASEPYVSSYVKDLKAEGKNVLLLNSGDTLHGQPFATISKGESVIKVMNAVGYDAMVPGNHDYNYGLARLKELEKTMDFDLLAANVINKESKDLEFNATKVFEVDGIKVGVFGLSTPETSTKTNPKNVEAVTFENPVLVAEAAVETLKEEGCNVIIALVHLGLDNETEVNERSDAIAKIDGVDLVVDGHSHTKLEEGLLVGDTYVAQTGEYGENIGVVEINIKDGKVASVKPSLVEVPTEKTPNPDFTPDPAVEKIINDINEGNDVITKEVIAKTAVKLEGEREDVRVKETNLANVITDAMINLTGADVAITNGGGIRASIEAGDVTKGDVLTVLPFGNYIVVKDITGSEFVKAIEHGIDTAPESAGKFAQIAGVMITYNPDAPVGSKIATITMEDGSPFDYDKTYKVATNDFMAIGGDGYTMLNDAKAEVVFSALDEAVISYLQTNPKISAEPKGRITVTDKTVVTPEVVPEEVVTPEEVPEVVVPEVVTPEVVAPVEPKPEIVIYIVKSGDMLWKIARDNGVTVDEIVKQNTDKIKNPNLIYPGQQLVIK